MSYGDSTAVSGGNQTGTVNSTLSQPLVAEVLCDGTCTVTWSSNAGDTFSPASQVVTPSEVTPTVSTTVTLSGATGPRTITLADSQEGTPATFAATAIAALQAVNDVATTGAGQPVTINVLANDSGDNPIASLLTAPAHGSVASTSNGVFTYTPEANYAGADQFTYRITDITQSSAQGVVAITVTQAPTPIPSPSPTPTNTPVPTRSPLSALPGLTPNQKSIAVALDSACPRASGQLSLRCRELYSGSLNNAQKIAALGQITPEQIAAQTTQFLRVGTNRMINIEHRLTALRHGAKGSQIALNVDGQSIPFGKLAQSLQNARGGSAGDSPDDPFRDSPLGVYVQGRYNGGDLDNTLQERGYRFNTFGFTMGADYRFSDQLILGMAWGYDSTAINYTASGGKMDTQTVHGVFYGSYYLPKDFYLDWIANYSGHDYEMTRNIHYTGFASNVRSNPNGSQYGVSVNLGKDFALADWTLNPYARTEYIKLHIDSYREQGGAGLGMAFDGQSATSLTTDLGAQIGRNFSLPFGIVTPSLRFEWEHQYEFDAQSIRGRFIGAAPGSGLFAISTADPQRDYFNLGGSIAATFAEGRSAFLRYETRLGQAPVSSHIVELGVRVPF